VGGHRFELGSQRRVAPHDWKDTRNGFPRGPADAHVASRRRRLTGPPWQGKYAADDFHPNDTGYGEWCAAFAEAIGLDGS